jgi:quercetin dioxygenase-like cupin family protein
MATGVQTDNAITLLDQIVHVGAGGGPVTHTHIQDEWLYVVSGQCTFNAGGHQGMVSGPGTFVAIPGDCEHSFWVDHPETQILNSYLPAGFEQLLIGISHPAMERKPPPADKILEMLPPKALSAKLAKDYGQTNTLGDPFTDPPDPNKMYTKPTPGATVFPFTANAKDMIPAYHRLGGLWTILATGAQTGGSYCMIEQKLRKGPISVPHVFNDTDEVFYILDGKMTFLLGDRVESAEKGAFIFIPRGAISTARVDSAEAHCLNLHTPSGFEKFIELVGAKTTLKGPPEPSFKEKSVDAGTQARLMKSIGMMNVAVADPLS